MKTRASHIIGRHRHRGDLGLWALVIPIQYVATGYLRGHGLLDRGGHRHAAADDDSPYPRRQLGHPHAPADGALASAPSSGWLLLFVPLLAVTFLGHHRDIIWGWMSPNARWCCPSISSSCQDAIYAKKKGFLSIRALPHRHGAVLRPVDLAGRPPAQGVLHSGCRRRCPAWTHQKPGDRGLRHSADGPGPDLRRHLLVHEPGIPLVLHHVRGVVLCRLHARLLVI